MVIRIDRDIGQIPPSLSGLNVEIRGPRELIVSYPPSKTNSGEILARIQEANLSILDISTKEAELEDIFLSLTGGPADGAS